MNKNKEIFIMSSESETYTLDQIVEKNKQEYISAINLITRPFDKDELIKMLEETDFFEAPASGKYHNAMKGGLCKHSLNVWKRLVDLNNMMETNLDSNSMAIVALCHDYAKINYYKLSYRNEKVYNESGSKSDNLGKYDWVSVPIYTIRDAKDRFIYGNHEATSEAIARMYIPLTLEESAAILNHHAGMSTDSAKNNIGEVYGRNTLALMLHLADMLCAFVDESRE